MATTLDERPLKTVHLKLHKKVVFKKRGSFFVKCKMFKLVSHLGSLSCEVLLAHTLPVIISRTVTDHFALTRSRTNLESIIIIKEYLFGNHNKFSVPKITKIK